jgi:basic amino acid/polyamine antiporter, APA family
MSGLKQDITLLDVVALGISAAIGVSIFSVISPAAQLAGPALLLSLAMAALPMVVFVVVYAFMGSTVPCTGASYEWPARFVHPYAGFIIAWLRILGGAGSLHLMSVVFVSYLKQAVQIPAMPTMLALLLVFYAINLVGIASVGRTARVLVTAKLVVLVTFILVGLRSADIRNFVPLTPHGMVGVLSAVPLLVSLYTGIESATEAGEEIRNGRFALGMGIAIATGIALIMYTGVAVVAIGVIGAQAVASSKAPLLAAGSRFLGPVISPVLLATALVAIASAVNVGFLSFARMLFAMARGGVLPSALARIHPRWGTPHIALTLVLLLGFCSLFLPETLVFLFLSANVPPMLKYATNCFAALRLVRSHPDLHARARFRLGRTSVSLWSAMGVLCAIGIIVVGFRAEWRPYVILLAWAGVGTFWWLLRARHTSTAMIRRRETSSRVDAAPSTDNGVPGVE